MKTSKVAWSRSYSLGPNPADVTCQIRQAIFDLAAELQRRREIHCEEVHRFIIVALHMPIIWDEDFEAKQEVKQKLQWR